MANLLNSKKGIAPSSILLSCIVVVILVIGIFITWSSTLSEYDIEVDDSFENSMDKSSELIDQYHSMDGKLDNTTGMQDTGTGTLIFDGLNSIVLGLKVTRAVIVDFTEVIGSALRVPPLLVQLITAILVIVLIAAIISALWSRDV